MTHHILLVGMMGAGKTTTGQLVATRLGWVYRDSDADVEEATGLTVPELFARDGEAAFRRAEATVLARACGDAKPSVISVAGGAVLSPENRALIGRSGLVVWLRARPETLAHRVGEGEGRPLLDDDPAASLVRLNEVRAPLYVEVSQFRIDVEGSTPEEVADQVIARWHEAQSDAAAGAGASASASGGAGAGAGAASSGPAGEAGSGSQVTPDGSGQ
jgi:shikimate kinase